MGTPSNVYSKMAMTDEDIIRARLLVDDRPLKRLIKKFYNVSTCNTAELDAAFAQFILELDSQDVLFQAKNRTSSIAGEERQTYEQEIAKIERQTAESEQVIADLKVQLALAQETRRNKIVYDSIAKEALKLPSRAHSAENIARLTTELKDLEAEQERYAATWAGRQQAFDAIVQSLEELGERVKEEKAEQERRDALGDDDVQEDGTTQPATRQPSAERDDTEDSQKKAHLDPNAKAFEPSSTSPQGDSAEGDTGMDIDEPADRKGEEAKVGGSRSGSTGRSSVEEGEEGEEGEEAEGAVDGTA